MKMIDKALTFDDILLLPGHSTVTPNSVSLQTKVTRQIALNIPVMSAAMDTVTDSRLAIAMAQEGGIGVIHKNASQEQQALEVKRVKKFESGVISDPITVPPDYLVRDLLPLAQAQGISGVPVVKDQQLVGIVTRRDWRFETCLEQPVKNIMTPKERLVTVSEQATQEEVITLLQKHRLEKLLMVNDAFELKGLITVKDIQKAKDYPLACKDEKGRLRVAAAVGTSEDNIERAHLLVQAGADILVVDTAHGHAQSVIDFVQRLRNTYPDVSLIAGNIATKEAALALVEAGVDGVKVGIGPGSICTTRVVTGVGVPQVTAIMNVFEALKGSDIPLIADGGIRYSGDVAKAIAAGAQTVMLGGVLAGTEEAPGETLLYQGRAYKSYRGMGSLGAMAQAKGARERYFQGEENNHEKLVPEGVEGRVPYKGLLKDVIYQLMGGLRSSMGYVGAETISQMTEKAQCVQVTSASMREGHVHDVTLTKEPPNYQRG